MNTNLIILNAKRESTKKDKGGYIILDWNSKNTPYFKVRSPEVSNVDAYYTIHPGKNYYYVPYKSIAYIGLTYYPMDSSKYVNSITFINFDLIDNLNMDQDLGGGCIYNFIDCKRITTNIPYIISPQSNVRILCNNDAIINLYKEHSSYNPQYTTDTCLEALNCDLSKVTYILLYDTRYTDIYIGDCITTAKSISTDYTTSKTGIKRVHIDKYDKDNIKLNMDEWACKNIIIVDDSTKKKYKPIYNTDKTQFAEIVNGTYSIPSLIKLTFTANADTTVKIYFTQESFDADTPDNTISLDANQEVMTSYARESIYKFKFNNPNTITSAKIEGLILNCKYLFNNCSNLITLDISKLDTSKVTNMSCMFSGCSKLSTIDVSNLDVSNVTDMYEMFRDCSGLITLDIFNWNISKVTTIDSMFKGCSNLTTIGKIDTAPGWQHKPNTYSNMFKNCPATPQPSWYK